MNFLKVALYKGKGTGDHRILVINEDNTKRTNHPISEEDVETLKRILSGRKVQFFSEN